MAYLPEKAIGSKNLTVRFLEHEASADELDSPSADLLSQTKTI